MKPKPERLLPFVFLNLAMSADGKIASANRSIPNFGSKTRQAAHDGTPHPGRCHHVWRAAPSISIL